MAFIYHCKAPDFRGSVIHQLNRLRDLHPDIYAGQVAKYAGRESLMDMVLPLLDVRWNDVIHCAPVHPHLVYRALDEAGGTPASRQWFEIPVERLAVARAVWLDDAGLGARGFEVAEEGVEPFDPARYGELSALPDETIAYYRAELAQGRRPLLVQYVPHVLVHGQIDVSGINMIDWSEPPRR